MSDPIPVGPALDQLRELISILRQLSNAGPRDNSFKQWRQVTLTLLQRVWAGDQTRAVRFRRIPFSAPSSKTDAKATRECFVRGVNEATAYLEGLALELEFAGKPSRPLVRPPEAPLAQDVSRAEPHREPESGHERFMSPGPVASPMQQDGPMEPSPWEATRPATHAAADGARTAADPPPAQSPPHAAPDRAAPANQEARKTAKGSRQRLKDMLGFSDEGATSPGAAEAISRAPAAPRASSQPTFAAPPRPAPTAPSPGPPTPVSPSPARATHDEGPAPPLRLAPTPAASQSDRDSDDVEYDLDALLADEAEPDADPPPATLREMLDRDFMPRTTAAIRAARDVRSMAAMVDQLGVPPERRAIVRAALIDLGQQMDEPPVHWATIRQALTFMMDYPQIARRVIPMLLPYLDEAA